MAKSAGDLNSLVGFTSLVGFFGLGLVWVDCAFAAARPRAKPAGSVVGEAPVGPVTVTAKPLATVTQFSGTPFLHEAKWLKGTLPNPKRRTEDAIYNGKRTRVIRLESDLPLFDGDSIETPGDASVELALPAGDRWLVHPGSVVELRESPAALVLGRGRLTLLVAGSGATLMPVEARGKRFEGLVTGAFVEYGETETVQGNELRAQEFVGFDDLSPVPPVSPAAPAPPAAQTPTPTPTPRVRDENPLDDVGDDQSESTRESRSPSTSAPSRGTDTLERGRVFLALGKVIDTSGDALARKVWSVHVGALAWISQGLAAEIAFDVLPRVSASARGLPFAHQRWNGSLGLRLSPATRTPVRFFLTPLVGVIALKGTFDVGAARDGSRVHSGVSVGPNFVYGLRTGAESSFRAIDLALLGHLTVRYSSDKVAVRHGFVEGRVGYALTWSNAIASATSSAAATTQAARPSLFLFARYENFLTEKALGELGRKDVETGWSLLGAGLAVAL